MAPTLFDIPTLVAVAGGVAAACAMVVVAVLVRWSLRKKRAASASDAAGLPLQQDEATTTEPAVLPASAQAVALERTQAGERPPGKLQPQPRNAPVQPGEARGESGQHPPSAAPAQREISELPTQSKPPNLEALADSGERRAPAVETAALGPNGLAQTPVQRSAAGSAPAGEGKAQTAELAKAPETAKAQALAEPVTGRGQKTETLGAPSRVPFALKRTRERFLARLRAVFAGGKQIEEICGGMEEALIEADVGVETSLKLIDAVRPQLKRSASAENVRQALKDEIARLLKAAPSPPASPAQPPLVVMLVGVNGVGKTTTVAKLAAYFKAERGSVIVGAADTFRAAAVEQLEVWCQRVGVDLIRHRSGGDPAAVAFDTVKAAVARRAAVALIDTAGRLQTKSNLMEELKKIARVVAREVPGAPHEVWLVLDATTGQNALSQAKLFSEAVPLTGVVLAKLDSSAKGGVVLGIADRLGLAVRFVGVGEGLQDLRAFDGQEFVQGMFETEPTDEEIAISAYSA